MRVLGQKKLEGGGHQTAPPPSLFRAKTEYRNETKNRQPGFMIGVRQLCLEILFHVV